MKIRQGFVSNSSSSSFTCSYCEEDISGMDMYPALRCVNDHAFCEYCVDKINISEPTLQEMIDYVAKYSKWEADEDITDEGFVQDVYGDIRGDHGIEASECPCCTLKHIPRSDLLPYLLKKYNLTINEVEEMMRADKK